MPGAAKTRAPRREFRLVGDVHSDQKSEARALFRVLKKA
jgi:hypothetical protein